MKSRSLDAEAYEHSIVVGCSIVLGVLAATTQNPTKTKSMNESYFQTEAFPIFDCQCGDDVK